MTDLIRIGSRRSKLARWQSDHVAKLLEERAGVRCEVLGIDTKGDRILDVPLPEIGAKGLFTAELEEMLLDGRVDIAVHSLKDLPGELPEGLTLGAISEREDPRDALVGKGNVTLDTLPEGAKLGTGSVRRAAQIRAIRPDLELVDIRGNVPTRAGKVAEGVVDATLLAAAGLKRLEMADRISEVISPERSVPAPGQGALGIECRGGDTRVLGVIATINGADAAVACGAERRIQYRLAGGCSAPVGIHATVGDDDITITVFVGMPDGGRFLRESITGPRADYLELADALHDRIVSAGGGEILRDARENTE